MNRLEELFAKIAAPAAPAGPVAFLVVGLGNPGAEYTNTRHNMGFDALDRIASDLGVKVDRSRFKALTTEAVLGGKRVLLMKPQTYMNLSGEAVREAAAFVGLDAELLDKSPFELSGGQKRRVAIAGVIAMEPKVLVLDEPTAGLEPQGRDAILAQIQTYHRAKGAAVVLVSHSMEEIARNVERIAVLSDGRVLMQGTPEQVFARAHELEQVGLDVPQVTKVAAALRARGLDIDPAVYTVEALEQRLLALRGGAGAC